jgi:hypothetical protein
MDQRRTEMCQLQDAIQSFVVGKNIPSDVAIAGIGELLIHYSVSNHGTNFTAKFLEKLICTLGDIQESVALIPADEGAA